MPTHRFRDLIQQPSRPQPSLAQAFVVFPLLAFPAPTAFPFHELYRLAFDEARAQAATRTPALVDRWGDLRN